MIDPDATRWFGKGGDTGRFHKDYEIPVPVGQPCRYCEEIFVPTDNGENATDRRLAVIPTGVN